MNRLLCLAGMLALVAAPAGATLSQEDTDLVEALRNLRSETIASMPSGRGSAIHSYTEHKVPVEHKLSVPEHKVAFVFSGPASLWKEYSPSNSQELFHSYLEKDSVRTRYTTQATQLPTAVSIDKATRYSAFTPEVFRWSYQEMSRLPMLSSEEEAWKEVLSRPRLDLRREASVIHLSSSATWNNEPEREVVDTIAFDFDLALGGMVTSWYHVQQMTGKNPMELSEKGELSWVQRDGHFVPVDRHVIVKVSENGRETHDLEGRTRYAELNPGPVSDKELSVANMEIPPGTPVVDHILKLQYRYQSPGEFGDANTWQNLPQSLTTRPTTRTTSGPPGQSPPAFADKPGSVTSTRESKGAWYSARAAQYMIAGVLVLLIGVAIALRRRPRKAT